MTDKKYSVFEEQQDASKQKSRFAPPFPSPSLFLRSVLVVVYAPAEVINFLSTDIPR